MLTLLLLAWAQETAPVAPFEKDIQPLLARYCFSCHGEEKPKGGLNLKKYGGAEAFQKDPKTLQKVLLQIREKEMPPEGKPTPNLEMRETLMGWLEKTLAGIDYSRLPKDPGRVLLHRLSRAEYNLTIRDLLGVDTRPADTFPADGSGGAGFDNIADTLFLPPILLEKYLAAAGDILDAADPKRLFVAPGDARKTLEHHLPRAFRRPARPGEIDRLLALFERSRKKGAPFEDALKTALKAVLVSPHFLYRVELDREGSEPYPVGDYELATRLSYFLWSSMPDDALFARAAEGKLHDPKALEAEVRRMIADPKFAAMAEGFAGQWLGTDSLPTQAQPDPRRFAAYTPSLRDAMMREVSEFFLHLVREDRSLLEMLDCDYAWVNEELAKHYGIPGVEGKEFRKVKLPDRTRGGVLGMAGVLTLTSYPQRTSPVLRGKWVLEEVFGTPAPPPPMNVGLLPPDDSPKDGLSFRQRLEAHRKKPECAACHNRLDPIGFGLENFDPIGRWRTEIAGKPVDSKGVLSGDRTFDGPVELKKILLERKDEFVRHATEKMLSYALGRGIEHYDPPAIKSVSRAVVQADHRATSMILEVATSYPFRYRRNNPMEETKR
jgi:hypothetical protein